MPKLIIIRGNSGSGKTTLANALQEKLGANTMLISHDMIRMKILHVSGTQGIEKSQPLLIDLLKYGRLHSEFTILEGILDSKQYQHVFEIALEEYGSDIFAYFYDVPFEETLLRHHSKPNCSDFGETDMRRWWKEKDYLTMISETVFSKDLSLKDSIDTICNDVL